MSICFDILISINLNIFNDGYIYILNFIIIYEKSKCDVKFLSFKYVFVWLYIYVVVILLCYIRFEFEVRMKLLN